MNKKIGSLWKHKKDNKSYLTGTLEVIAGFPIKVCVFSNDKKEQGSKQPDFNVVLSKSTEEKKSNVTNPENAFD